MAADPVTDAWMETCLISVADATSGTEVDLAGFTETVDFDDGEKDIEGMPLVNGGRIAKWSPETDSTITFEGYTVPAGGAQTSLGLFPFVHDITEDAAVPYVVTNSRVREKFRVAFLWTNDTTATSAVGATAENASAYRKVYADGYFTKVATSFTDGIVKVTATFKCTAFDKSGNSNRQEAAATGTSPTDKLAALGTYTHSNKF